MLRCRAMCHANPTALQANSPYFLDGHVQAEIDAVLQDRAMPNFTDYTNLRYVTRCVCESMRLYPHPPVLLRRATMPDVLPGGYEVRLLACLSHFHAV